MAGSAGLRAGSAHCAGTSAAHVHGMYAWYAVQRLGAGTEMLAKYFVQVRSVGVPSCGV